MWSRRLVTLVKLSAALTVTVFLAGLLRLSDLQHRFYRALGNRALGNRSAGLEFSLSLQHQQRERIYPPTVVTPRQHSNGSDAAGSVRLFLADRPPGETLPLFPEDSLKTDRILEQLSYTVPEDRSVKVKLILLVNSHKAWKSLHQRDEFVKSKCAVDSCSITRDPAKAGEADAIVFKDNVKENLRGFRSDHKRPPNQTWIFYTAEQPGNTPSLQRAAPRSVNWTASWRRDADLVVPLGRWAPYEPRATPAVGRHNYAAGKTKKVVGFFSDCQPSNQLFQYVWALSRYIRVDVYMRCGDLDCSLPERECFQLHHAEYKFYLAFENVNCRDYISDKFFMGLRHNIIPIVMGAHPDDYAAAAPPRSHIHVEHYAGPAKLAEYLHHLDDDDQLYNQYFEWKSTGELIDTFFFCRLCAMLHAADIERRVKSYSDLESWAHRPAQCTAGDWCGNASYLPRPAAPAPRALPAGRITVGETEKIYNYED